MTTNAPTLAPHGALNGAPASASQSRPAIQFAAPITVAPTRPTEPPAVPMFGDISMRDRAASRFAHCRRKSNAPRQAMFTRGTDILDGFLLLFAVCALLLPTAAGYALATAAAQSLIGLPFAVLMFVSPFALMALLPLRLIHLALDGLFGIRLRVSLLAPLSLVCLAMFLMLGPLNIRPAQTATAIAPAASLPSLS